MRLINANALIDYCNNTKDKTIDANDIARFPTVGGWISVKDMLPKKRGDYLIYNTDGTVWPYWYDADDNSWYDSCGYKTDIVTHWMPLPEPPKENEENGNMDV